MPTRERIERERQRDAIRDIAWGIAEHVAGADMISVERLEHGAVVFNGRPDVLRCTCGLALAPMPQRMGRYGWLPLWVCGVCSIDTIIDLAIELRERTSA